MQCDEIGDLSHDGRKKQKVGVHSVRALAELG
jgi:hypothetical protein